MLFLPYTVLYRMTVYCAIRHPTLNSYFLGLVADSKNEVGPDSRTSPETSDGQSDILGHFEFIGVGQKSDRSRTEVGQITFESRTDGQFF